MGCIKLEGYYSSIYSNYKRQDKRANCKVRDIDKYKFRYIEELLKEEYETVRERRTIKPVNYKPADRRKTQ
jgi:hypothetical protein